VTLDANPDRNSLMLGGGSGSNPFRAGSILTLTKRTTPRTVTPTANLALSGAALSAAGDSERPTCLDRRRSHGGCHPECRHQWCACRWPGPGGGGGPQLHDVWHYTNAGTCNGQRNVQLKQRLWRPSTGDSVNLPSGIVELTRTFRLGMGDSALFVNEGTLVKSGEPAPHHRG